MHEVLDSRAELSDHPPPRKEAIDDNKENRRDIADADIRNVLQGLLSMGVVL